MKIIRFNEKFSNMCSDPTFVFSLNENFFEFPKKLQVLDQVHFKKIYNDWISQHL